MDALHPPARRIRIPDGQSVELPEPFARIVDHPDFQRLRRVRQLSSIHLVYPGAVHTRFEHSLGVFRAAWAYQRSLMSHARFRDAVTARDCDCLLAAALLHDVGHYPFAHSLEALHSQAFEAPRHEDLAADIILGTGRGPGHAPSLGELIEDGLDVPRDRVARMVQLGSVPALGAPDQLLASVINSAIDADKLDYLERDSIHMGVPYGRMPDRSRLLASLTLNADATGLALVEKGRVAAEIFLFCRYLMFSEAYWHHAARAASAMVEAALADYTARTRPSGEALRHLLLSRSDDELLSALAQSGGGDEALSKRLLTGLTVNQRGLYKRVLTLSRQREDSDLRRAYDVVYQMGRDQLAELTERLATRVRQTSGVEVRPGELLVDTPPRDKDRMDSVPIVFESATTTDEVPLEDLSTVVRGIARDFVKVVKKIRVFISPRVRHRIGASRPNLEMALLEEILDSPPPVKG